MKKVGKVSGPLSSLAVPGEKPGDKSLSKKKMKAEKFAKLINKKKNKKKTQPGQAMMAAQPTRAAVHIPGTVTFD